MGDFVEVETQNNLQYVFFPVSSSAVQFKVKAKNDAHIALTRGAYESTPMTEIRIGGWGNTKSSIRRDRRKPCKVVVESPHILDRHAFKSFWVRWYNNTVAAGYDGSEEPFMRYCDPECHPIDHVGFRTGWGSTGSWIIEVSPVIYRLPPSKPVKGGELRWVKMSSEDAQLPLDAVIGGFEKGELLYIARATHRRSMCPGKYVPSLRGAVVAWGHRAHWKDHFEILCGYDATWEMTRDDILPPHAFPGGHSGETNEALYIGRAFVDNHLIPGKIHLHYKTCYIPHEDIEREVQRYEVLVIPDKLPIAVTWRPPPQIINY